MKDNLSKYLSCIALIVVITALFLINPFFENKYLDAERNVQIFKKDHRPEYDSLKRMYDIQFELIKFKNDSAKNVINQVFLLRNHKMEMQKLTGSISNLEYERLFNENYYLKVTEQSIVNDSFGQRLIRLHHPNEMKVPRDLSKEVTLYHGIYGFIGLMKWLILVFAVFIFIIEILKNDRKNPSNTVSPTNPKVTGAKFTNDPRRQTKEAELIQQAEDFKHIKTGNVTVAELTTPSSEDNVQVYVVSDFTEADKETTLVRRIDGEPFENGELTKGFPSEWVNKRIEIPRVDFIQAGLADFDQMEMQRDLLNKNQIQIDGIPYILTGDQTNEGYVAVNPEDGSDIVIPASTVDNIRNSGQLQPIIIPKVNEPINNESVTEWEKSQKAKPKVPTRKVKKGFKEMSKYNVVEDGQGNKIISELTTLEQANALKDEVERFMKGDATILAKLIPNEDKTAPQMYQLTIVFKDII